MHTVFDDEQTVGAHDGRHRFAARHGHGGAGRVVQRGCAVDKLGIKGLGGALQGLRHHTFVVGFHANELQPHGARQGLQAGVAQRFRQHGVARAGHSTQYAGQTVLCAVRDHHPVPLAAGAKAAQPLGARFAVAAHAGLALVAQHLAHQVRVG